MKVTVEIQGVRHKASCPFEGADHVVAPGVEECPGCKAKGPLAVQGAGKRIESRDTYAADAVTKCCAGWVGTIRVKVNTLFGIEEDEAVARQCVRLGGKIY